jgi:PKD repeat protein
VWGGAWIAICLGCLPVRAGQLASNPRPPREPEVAPLVPRHFPSDNNNDRIQDSLGDRAKRLHSAANNPARPADRLDALNKLGELVHVELIFTNRIAQKHLDDFLAHGGEVTHLYEATSYGWNGRLPLGKILALPALMGDALVQIEEDRPAVLHLDQATLSGRVRPVWAAGFAGTVSGFDGDTNTTIAILDTGVDETHTDLNGRRVFWHDYTSDNEPLPYDLIQHGTHCAGIAFGTGAAAGSATGNLLFTDEGNLTGVSAGSFYPSPFSLSPVSTTVNLVATWQGGGSTTLYLVYHNKGTAGGYTAQNSISGTSPLTLNTTFTPLTTRAYSAALLAASGVGAYNITVQANNFTSIGDGFNKLRGVAPGCNWAGAKVFSNTGSGSSLDINAGIDGLVANRVANNIKVMNVSLGIIGSPGISTSQRAKVNTAVNSGIVVCCSAGNDGNQTTAAAREVDDPGRAALAITVGAANDINQLTDYTSVGFTSPSSTSGQQEDYKPDLIAPGGSSSYYSSIMSVDSNSGDGQSFGDQRTNDYYNIQGTSMSAPFIAGCAALVIDALQQRGTNWSFASSQHPRLVKMLLCATSSETNTNRDSGANNPTLQRAATGPNGFPVGKDRFEGYGMANPDAAVEAVALSYMPGTTETNALGGAPNDKRVWARSVQLPGGVNFSVSLDVPGSCDLDLHLYSRTPNTYGTPILLASSTLAGLGADEAFNYTPAVTTNAILVVKRISGSGAFSLVGTGPVTANFSASPTNGSAPLVVTFTNFSSSATNYSWSFGDGNVSTNANPTNTYAAPGIYNISLTAFGAGGSNTLTRSAYITVTNAPPPPAPVANFIADITNGLAPLLVTFTNLSSNATEFAWDFGNGSTSTNTHPSNTYSNAGVFSVSLTAIGLGATNAITFTNYITVTNLPPAPAPVANFIADITSGLAPLTVNFTNLSTNATDFAWDFGDGNTSTNEHPSNTYSNVGVFSVSLTAIGLGGTNAVTFTNYITVTNLPPPPAPVANFIADITSGLAPLTVNFTNLSTNATDFAWDFGDGNTSTNTHPSNTYSNAGAFSVSLTAIGLGGTNAVTFTNYITVTNLPPLAPVANFIADTTSGLAPLTVNFTNLSTNATDFAWDFGDGNTSTNEHPSNTYSNAGVFSVSLTAIGLGGTNAITFTNYITVTNLPPPPAPVANFTADITSGLAPLLVNFTNLSTNATDFAWDFGDGNTSTNTHPSNTYSNAGVFSVSLTAIGLAGTNAITFTNYITITNLPPPAPVANFIADITSGLAPLLVNFTNLSTNATDFAWDFGDGNTSTNEHPSNTYSNTGEFSVSLTAIGLGGTNAVTFTNYITVTNLPPPPAPVANFIADITSGLAPLLVTFTNLSTNATDFAWDFGNGNTSTNEHPSNTYSNAGVFSVSLTAIGLGGTNAVTFTNYITVTNLPPPVLAVLPASLFFSPLFTGSVAHASFVISNSGGSTLNATGNLSAAQFTLLDATSNAAPAVALDLPALAATNLLVRFHPLAQGAFTNAVTFLSNGGDSTNQIAGIAFGTPVLLESVSTAGEFAFAFDTVPGLNYTIEFKDTLDDPIWQTLQIVPGDGSLKVITNLTLNPAQRFYRIKLP